MKQYKYKLNKGFTLTELMVGLSIGIVVLTGLMSFYFRSTKMIGEQQAVVKDLNQLQGVMNKIADDIRSANTIPPEMSSITRPQWDLLPYMGYGHVYSNTLDAYNMLPTEPKDYPIYPVAYNFPYQAGLSYDKTLYPKNNYIDEKNNQPVESNQLVFYKVENNQILRVIYKLDPNNLPTHLSTYNLKRVIQYPSISTTTKLEKVNPSDSSMIQESVILSNVKFIQFTYPVLAKKLTNISSDPEYSYYDYDSQLRAQIDNLSDPTDSHERSVLMNPYRNTIKIRVATAGPQIGDKKIKALELNTEVTVRN